MGSSSSYVSKAGLLGAELAPALPPSAAEPSAETAARADGRAYEAYRFAGLADFLAEIGPLGPARPQTPFQTAAWLGPFYASLVPAMKLEPVLIGVRETASGQLAMLLPLVKRRRAGFSTIELADLDVCDYAFPLLGPAAPTTPVEAAGAWRAALGCLPAADLVRLDRLLTAAGETPNPLLIAGARPSRAIRNATALPDSWDAYLASCSKRVRKDIRQKTRAILRDDGATFRVVTEAGEAVGMVEQLDRLQRARLEEIGLPFRLDRAPYSTFYREAVRLGATDGTLLIALLEGQGEVVAAAMLLLAPGTGTLVRLSHAAGSWSRRSPSVVLAGCVIKWLIESGYRTLDFGNGRYAYKQRFGCELLPLYTVEQPLTMKGRLLASAMAGGRALRSAPMARALECRLHRGKAKPAGEGD